MTTGIRRGNIKFDNPYDPKFAHVELDVNKFNALIYQYGIRILHEKATICPNYLGAISSQQHDTNCTICDNSYFFHDPKKVLGYFSTNEMVRNYFRGGFWEHGSALLTVPSFYENNPDDQVYVSLNDRFTLLDFEDRFYEAIHHNVGNVDKLRYKAIKILMLRTAKQIYEENRHFKLNENGDIEWLNNVHPGYSPDTGLGEVMSVSYLYRPMYRVTQMLHEGRFSQQTFKVPQRTPLRYPQQMMIKKDFLIDKKDADGNVIPEPKLP